MARRLKSPRKRGTLRAFPALDVALKLPNLPAAGRQPYRGKYTVALILLVCILPFVGSYALYLFWRPERLANYGELIRQASLAEVTVRSRGGGELRFADLRGKWVFLMADSGACDAHCRRKLYYMRQIRLTQGKDQERIERLWLITDDVAPAAAIDHEYRGTLRVAPATADFVSRLPAPGSVRDHIYLVDPLGNLMMRFPRDLDPNRMKKDVARLISLSRGWVEVK